MLDTNTALTNVLMETSATGQVQAYNIYGLGLIARLDASDNTRYLHYDPRGSAIALTDDGAAITDQYAYDPFGQLANRTGSDTNPFRYLGRHGVLDDGGDLNYIRARYYDAEQQRFISKDPWLGEERNAQTRHRYAYVVNNPVRLVDISGFVPTDTIEAPSSPTGPTNNSRLVDELLDDGTFYRAYLAYLETGIQNAVLNAVREGIFARGGYTFESLQRANSVRASLGALATLWSVATSASRELERMDSSLVDAFMLFGEIGELGEFAMNNPDALVDALNSANAVTINSLTLGILDVTGEEVGCNTNGGTAFLVRSACGAIGVAWDFWSSPFTRD